MSESTLLSIGHSTHDFERFLDLLSGHHVDVLADVRSSPFSRYAPQFDRTALENGIGHAGIKYVFLGRELGGRPVGDEYYDREGHVLYGRVANSPLFLIGLERLRRGMQQYCIAILCSEEDPAVCHRALLIGKVLAGQGVRIQHIRGDGTVQSQRDLLGDTAGVPVVLQLSLIGEQERSGWRSLHPVPRHGNSVSRG